MELRFGDFTLDQESGELRKGGELLKLKPQPARVLELLMTRPGKVVTREEIQKELWADDTHVDFDLGINSCIRQIRIALEDDAEEPAYVQTVSRRGYRFLGRVELERAERSEREGSPYPGLSSFTERDVPFFFGREGEVEPSSPKGWKVDIGPFPGWKNLPIW